MENVIIENKLMENEIHETGVPNDAAAASKCPLSVDAFSTSAPLTESVLFKEDDSTTLKMRCASERPDDRDLDSKYDIFDKFDRDVEYLIQEELKRIGRSVEGIELNGSTLLSADDDRMVIESIFIAGSSVH